jgi:hypothetical protein
MSIAEKGQCNFKFISPQMWWIVDMGFSYVIDRKNATQAQSKYLHIDSQATNVFYRSMDSSIFCEIMNFKSAREIWMFLNEKYGTTSNDDEPKEEVHEDIEHDHSKVVVEDCSTSLSSDDKDDYTTRSLDKIDDNATSDASDDSTSCTLDGEDDGMRVMLQQALQHHHIVPYHMVTLRYRLVVLLLIVMVQILSFYINSQRP